MQVLCVQLLNMQVLWKCKCCVCIKWLLICRQCCVCTAVPDSENFQFLAIRPPHFTRQGISWWKLFHNWNVEYFLVNWGSRLWHCQSAGQQSCDAGRWCTDTQLTCIFVHFVGGPQRPSVSRGRDGTGCWWQWCLARCTGWIVWQYQVWSFD